MPIQPKIFALVRRGLRRVVRGGTRRFGCRRREDLLPDVLLDLLQGREVLAHLLLFGGELVLIGRKLPDVPPHHREIDYDQLNLLRHFR